MRKEEMRRELETMPFDKAFTTESGNEELCHATGYEVCLGDPDDAPTGGRSSRTQKAICIMVDNVFS